MCGWIAALVDKREQVVVEEEEEDGEKQRKESYGEQRQRGQQLQREPQES